MLSQSDWDVDGAELHSAGVGAGVGIAEQQPQLPAPQPSASHCPPNNKLHVASPEAHVPPKAALHARAVALGAEVHITVVGKGLGARVGVAVGSPVGDAGA